MFKVLSPMPLAGEQRISQNSINLRLADSFLSELASHQLSTMLGSSKALGARDKSIVSRTYLSDCSSARPHEGSKCSFARVEKGRGGRYQLDRSKNSKRMNGVCNCFSGSMARKSGVQWGF